MRPLKKFENGGAPQGGSTEPSWKSAASEEELAKIEELQSLAERAQYGDGRVLLSDGKLDPAFVSWQKQNYGSRRFSAPLGEQKERYLLDMKNQLVSSIEARQAAGAAAGAFAKHKLWQSKLERILK